MAVQLYSQYGWIHISWVLYLTYCLHNLRLSFEKQKVHAMISFVPANLMNTNMVGKFLKIPKLIRLERKVF